MVHFQETGLLESALSGNGFLNSVLSGDGLVVSAVSACKEADCLMVYCQVMGC